MTWITSQTRTMFINLDNTFSVGVYTSEGAAIIDISEIDDTIDDYKVWALSDKPNSDDIDDNALTGHCIFIGTYKGCIDYINTMKIVSHIQVNDNVDW